MAVIIRRVVRGKEAAYKPNAKKKKTPSKPNPKDVPSGRAIAIQQPHVEQILRGTKKYEWRSRPTKIRGRVYLYASLSPGHESFWKKIKLEPGDLPTGVILGSVNVVDCVYFKETDDYGYKLEKPKRYKNPLIPKNQAQPCWFFPFGEVKGRKKK
jgi:ASCH domain